MRDHTPIVLDKFNGLYQRGSVDEVPLDRFTDCDNIRYIATSSFGTRYGIGISQDVDIPLENIKRIYNYPTQSGNTLIVLTYDYLTDMGSIYHYIDETTLFGPILTIEGMTDFAFVPYAGRAYISPFASLLPTSPDPASAVALTLDQTSNNIEPGVHKYAYTFLTAIGETTPSPLASITTLAALANPTAVPLPVDDGAGSNLLTAGQTYKWKFALSRTLTGAHETLAGPASMGFVAPASDHRIAISSSTGLDPTLFVVGYRTIGGGTTYYREFIVTVAALPDTAVGTISDADIIANPEEPIVNDTEFEAVQVNNILIGPPDTIGRNLYRTEADDDQLKLLVAIADNTTDDYLDEIADAGLGVDAPESNTATIGDLTVEKGLQNEFLYVYAGDGTAARKAAGSPMSGNMTIANGAAGHTDAGRHIFGFVSETISGYLSPPGLLETFTTNANFSVSFGNVTASGDPNVVARHLVASKVIPNYNGDLEGYALFFVPNATIENNTDLFLNNISFFDQDLLEDASHLFDNFSEIPAGAVLTLYHNRLILGTTFNDISLLLVSEPGEPEAISQIDGLIVVTLDGNPITNARELRDVLYVMKRSRTVSFIDNGDVPSSWPETIIDNALGCPIHGIATVLDSGSASVDALIVCTYQGVTLFSGSYVVPELSWSIEDFWRQLDRHEFRKIQIVNAPIQKEIYIILPDRRLLVGNYGNGMTDKNIRWAPWSFIMGINTIAIFNIDEIIFGADLAVLP